MTHHHLIKKLRVAPIARVFVFAQLPGFLVLVLILMNVTGTHSGVVAITLPQEGAVVASDTTPADDVGLPESAATVVPTPTSPTTHSIATPTTVLLTPPSTTTLTVVPSVPPSRPATTPTAVPVVPTATPRSYAPITRLLVPEIGVDALVEVQSLDPDGTMQTPGGPDVVAWYDFSSQPVDAGNAVFAGHLDYAGYGPAVFWRLGDLQSGDLIETHHLDGTVVQYHVTSVRPFAATDDASGVVASRGRPTITLITCDGVFDSEHRAYDERLVVTGDRID